MIFHIIYARYYIISVSGTAAISCEFNSISQVVRTINWFAMSSEAAHTAPTYVCVALWFIVLTHAHLSTFKRILWVLTSVMGSAGFGWSGLSGRFVGDVAAAGCTPGPKPNKVRQINMYICISMCIKYVFNNCLIAVSQSERFNAGACR